MSVPSMSKRTDSTLISTMWGFSAGVIWPVAVVAKEPRRDGTRELGIEDSGVGMADMVKASLVKTDMVMRFLSWKEVEVVEVARGVC